MPRGGKGTSALESFAAGASALSKLSTRGPQDGRETYSDHYSGLQAYGNSGLTKLEELIDAAIQARDNAPHTSSVKFGAAVLSKKGQIFTGCNVESASNSGRLFPPTTLWVHQLTGPLLWYCRPECLRGTNSHSKCCYTWPHRI